MIKFSKRVTQSETYAFAEVDRKKEELKAKGIDVIDFGVGDPESPTPEFVREAGKCSIDAHACSGYPSYIGMKKYREEIAKWMKKRFNVELDPDKEITSTVGAKEGVFHAPLICADSEDDIVIVPTPGYPPYKMGTLFAGGTPYFIPLMENKGFMIDFLEIPSEILNKAKMMFINYPNNPTGAMASDLYLGEIVARCQHHGIILASDECYSEMYFGDEKPKSVLGLGHGKEGMIVFQSLSKRSNMTGWRIGWACGDEKIIEKYKNVKTQIDSGTPNFVQEAAVAALRDERHVRRMRQEYRKKKDILVNALSDAGFPRCEPEGTFYIWQRAPEKYSGNDIAAMLLDKKIAINVTPGAALGETLEWGYNPGKDYVRFALVPSLERTVEAAERIRNNLRL